MTNAAQAIGAAGTRAPLAGLLRGWAVPAALAVGGARGLAHIGVLRVPEELRVPVHIVVRTSFGAIVGGAYAGGVDVAELERLVLATDWSRVLQDRPPRDALTPSASLLEAQKLLLVYRAGATSMLNGEMVTPEDVRLFTAMRASMSVPGARGLRPDHRRRLFARRRRGAQQRLRDGAADDR